MTVQRYILLNLTEEEVSKYKVSATFLQHGTTKSLYK